MPNLNGFDLLRWINENASLVKIPAIVLSGALSEASVKLAYKLGAVKVALKPNAVEEYMLRIKSILRLICREATAHVTIAKTSMQNS
jgi:DNA-binding response OmpR family regulator